MTIIRHELRQGLKTLAVWTAAIGFFIVICVFMYPEMKGETAGIAKGKAAEQKHSIRLLIETCQRLGESPEDTISWIQKQYPVTIEDIKQIMKDSF